MIQPRISCFVIIINLFFPQKNETDESAQNPAEPSVDSIEDELSQAAERLRIATSHKHCEYIPSIYWAQGGLGRGFLYI